MTRYVIGPDVALRLAHDRTAVRAEHQLVAPALIRSQLVSLLFTAVGRGELTKKEAARQLDYVRGLRMRLLGDRVLQSVAWDIADQLGWSDTFDAEYVAVTRLQADALVTLDDRLAEAVQVVRDKQSPDGRWKRARPYPGRYWSTLEPAGPSRWATLRALRVLRWWDAGERD